jgi:hypothetical protein
MELLAIWRLLWARRIVVAIGAVVAIALGVLVGKAQEPSRSSLATTRVVLDTHKSQLVDVAPDGADSLQWRTGLLADVMMSRSMARVIAREAGIEVDQLKVIEPLMAVAELDTPLAQNAIAAAGAPEPYVVTYEADPDLPFLKIMAAAPDRGSAFRLAEAATRAAESADVAHSSKTLQGFVIEPAAGITLEETVTGGKRIVGVAAFLFVFGAWCAAVALLPGVVAGARRLATTARPAEQA